MTERDARISALKTEEAVLMPALPRQSMTVGAALKAALRNAANMKEKRTGSTVAALSANEHLSKPTVQHPTLAHTAASRAALHQALRRKQ